MTGADFRNPSSLAASSSSHACETLNCTKPSAEICGSTVIVSAVEPGDSAPFGATAAFGLGLPARTETIFASLPDKPGWRCYVTRAGNAPAAAATFTDGQVALLAVDDLGNLDAAQFDSLMTACKASSVLPVVVAGNAVAGAAAPWSKLGGGAESPLLLCDADKKFLPALLAQGGVGLGPAGSLRMRVIVLDPNQRIAATFDSRALPSAAEAMEA